MNIKVVPAAIWLISMLTRSKVVGKKHRDISHTCSQSVLIKCYLVLLSVKLRHITETSKIQF